MASQFSIQIEVHAVAGRPVEEISDGDRTPRPGPRLLASSDARDAQWRNASPSPEINAGVIVDDRTLFAQMRAGESHAIALLFERYYGALCAFATTFTNSLPVAEEVVEDLFLHLWTSRNQLEVRDSVKAYLYAAVRNRSLNWSRRERTSQRWIDRAHVDDDVPGMGEAPPSTDEEVYSADLRQAVTQAIDLLPPRTRQVFLLHRQHQLTYIEIGAALEISPRTVENLISRALRQLRLSLGPLLRG
jgi:RNA polymerase sigma-70 factor (ECF subfamily)